MATLWTITRQPFNTFNNVSDGYNSTCTYRWEHNKSPNYKAENVTQRSKGQSQRLATRTTYKTCPAQSLGGKQKNTTKKRRIFSKKESFTLFCFSTLHSLTPYLSVGGVVAGTTPVTIDKEVVPSSEGIGGNCALSTDEIHTSSVWRRLWERHFQIHIWKRSFHQPFTFRWNPT